MCKFAVVIPTHRRPEFLVAAVESVLRQSYPAAEIVVVRDGPDALVPDEIDTSRVSVVDNPKLGVAAARNTGVAATSSEWLCFLDDDDLWHPDRLRVLAEYISAHPECSTAQAGSWTFASSARPYVDLVASTLDECLAAAATTAPVSNCDYLDITGHSFDLLLERLRGAISTATVRRDVLEKAGGFPAGYTCAEDWVMFLNVARYTEWHYCDRRLSFVRKHAGNNTVTNPTNDIVTIRALRRVWEDDAHPVPPHRPLTGYALEYRLFVQTALWRAVRTRHARIAVSVLREGYWLLPRARDRAVVLVPPALNRLLSRVRSAVRSSARSDVRAGRGVGR